MPPVPDRWAILRVRFVGPFVVVRLRDDLGVTLRTHWEGGLAWPGEHVPQIAAHLGSLVATLPEWREGPHTTGRVPLPLFVDLPPFLWQEPSRIDTFLRLLLPPGLADRVQVAGLTATTRRPRPPFTLPFRVLAHGVRGHDVLAGFAGGDAGDWTSLPDVAERGFALDLARHDDAAVLAEALRAVPRDVLVTSEPAEAAAVVRALPMPMRPRLILAPDSLGALPFPAAPLGVALAFTGGMAADVREVLYGLVHDLPLHEAVKAADRRAPAPPFTARLFANPSTNQSLRMRDALIALQDEAEALALRTAGGPLDAFLDRVGPPQDEDELESDDEDHDYERGGGGGRGESGATGGGGRRRSRGHAPDPAHAETSHQLEALCHEAWSLRAAPQAFESFERETTGLVPMASVAARLADLRLQAASLQDVAGEAVADPAVRDLLEAHQTRVVDIGLQRLETGPLLTSLDRRTALQAGARYRLRVHIGNPAPDSLVVGPQPAIDPLLPAPAEAGHDLDIVVQGKAFAVEGERLQTVNLPRFGGTTPVYVTVRAPVDLGETSLRVHVYHRTHLVHSYLLEADVAPAETRRDTDVLRATLAYARVERLADVDAVQPRRLSIGINDSGGRTHDIVFKGRTTASEVSLPALTYQAEVDAFYKALEQASRDPRNPKFGRRYAPVTPGASAPADAAAVLRDLIQKGADLYESMRNAAIAANRAIAAEFAQIKRDTGQKIQVTRFNLRDVFPWPLVYDFRLPPLLPNAPVCLGLQPDANGAPQPCGHAYDSGVYCVNGFWSVRHVLEELLPRDGERHDKVARPPQDGVRLVCDTRLNGVPTLATALAKSIGAPHVVSGPQDENTLLDLLWKDPPERPAILVLLGHMDTALVPGRLDSEGIVLRPNQWLTRRHFSDKIDSVWDDRRPVVMLMACDAAALAATTLNSFVTNFHTAGASAIVGAQAVVGSDLAAQCARELTEALWAGDSLGTAMTHLRQRLLASGNPLAFLFHAIGDVDLTLEAV